MTARLAIPLAAILCIAACGQPAGPTLTISNIVILEPLPGSGMAAGYLAMENHSDRPITIVKVSSPAFASIEMHETVIEDEVARMISLAPLVIGPKSAIVFEPGGKHLMMSGAAREMAPGEAVTIEFHDNASGLVAVATTVRSRQGFQE